MPRPLLTLALFGLLTSSTAWAQSPLVGAPTQGTQPSDNVPLADYLGLLLAAFARRCGRTLTPAELRRAMADGDGDPALMGLIRANHLGDTAGREQLAGQIRCPGQATR